MPRRTSYVDTPPTAPREPAVMLFRGFDIVEKRRDFARRRSHWQMEQAEGPSVSREIMHAPYVREHAA